LHELWRDFLKWINQENTKMKNIVILIAVFVLGWVVFNKFNPASTKKVSFEGTWQFVDLNGISGNEETSITYVATDGNRFRLETTATSMFGTSKEIKVYDGSQLHLRSEFNESGRFSDSTAMVGVGDDGDESQFPEKKNETHTSTPTKGELGRLRFWEDVIDSRESAGAGGMIAGRETVLYQFRENRIDGKATIQRWLDAENKTLLKFVSSLYSTQVESIVFQNSIECLKIAFAPVGDATFVKP
jgi:hypothetical protein